MRSLLFQQGESDGMAGSERAVFQQNPIKWLIISGGFLIAAIVIGTAMMVGTFRERALASAERELENAVLLLARHFDQQFGDLHRMQQGVVAHLRSSGIESPEDFTRRMSGPDPHRMLNAMVSDAFSTNLNLVDANGRLFNSSAEWPVTTLDLADREYFQSLKSDASPDREVLQPVFSRKSGSWRTLFARALTGSDGQFLGVLTKAIDPIEFEKFFATVALGPDSSISMFHSDGTLLARYPHIESMIGKNFKSGPLMQSVALGRDHATMRIQSPVDGEDRLGAIRNLVGYPISIIATITVESALADWRAQTRFLIGVATLSALVIAVVLSLMVRQIQRQHRASRRRLELEKQRLNTAINNMTQGLLLFSAAERVVVCNQRYLDMYGLSREIIKPGCTFRDVIAHRKETGSFEGDIDDYVAEVLREIDREKVTFMKTADGRAIQVTNKPVAGGGWVATHEDITERKRSDERIAHLAHYDALTDLPNRVLFAEQVAREIAAIGADSQFAILYIDIDEFKGINDSLGHAIGDELLKSIGNRLRGCVGPTDFVARLGGDEFAIVQTGIADRSDVTDLVTRIHDEIRKPFECLGHQIQTDASIGIALAPRDGGELDQLLKNADLAMYGAKTDGRRTSRFFEPEMEASVKARRALELDLRQAIVEGGLEVHYQPLVDLGNGIVSGCEALLRWHHPLRGTISPAEFIPVAEDTGLINELGEWVLKTACAEAATWPEHVKLAVNVSPVQFKSATLALKVAAALAASGLPASRLELEITETVLIRDDEAALAILHQLRAIGVRIALDDFGTGYSSLSYLQRFPFDKIKIDRCFVTDITEPGGSAPIVQAVVNIAAARNMTTTAEGVETEPQQALLRTLGCTEMQGYLFSPAKSAADIKAMFRSRADSGTVAA